MIKTWSKDDPKAGLMTRKRALIVDAALKAFLDRGYAESSVNKIAEDAGVSIKTVYRHFETKDELFSAVMQAACLPNDENSIEGPDDTKAPQPTWYAKPPNIGLALAGEEYLRHILSEDQLALYRVVARDAHRFPELRRRYLKEAVGQRVAAFADYLDRWAPEMGWSISNKLAALTTFAGLLKASLFDDALLGLRKPKDQEIVRQAREAAARMLILLEADQF
ncbi:TetR/AcrR family transcriptional regulator [Bradyrhizobium sp. 200]|uniref:TetR/AcrR family transcriptional regulator n=1 Tax=Bradyrhizobium sp. 200 TaxID=2782665 RepID=UPI001FFF9C44|nr:TetR/AcrR family transcriptional regulator [Bradyrhizobium sp. 200]UPJ48327.1 TetR/AcrR family transcriptional regulator [Bradyrhizobium sp. 200]